MAENLVGYGFLNKEHRSVEEVLVRAEKIAYSAKDNEMKEFLADLKDIKRRVETQEHYFYQAFGVNDFDGLNEKLQEIEQSYAALLARGAAIWNIRKHINFEDISNAQSPEEIREALGIAIENFLHEEGRQDFLEEILLNLTDGQTVEESVGLFIQQNLRLKDQGSGKKSRFITHRGGNKVGLGKFIVGYDLEKHEVILETKDIRVSQGFKKKMEEVLNILVPTRVRKRGAKTYTNSGFRKRINDLALEVITDKQAYKCISEAMSQKEQFDLKPNLSSVIGYLGEVRAVAMLNHLMPKDDKGKPIGRASGVGNVFGKFSISGRSEEIPIDVLCMGWGFQIKNYTLQDSRVTFSNEAKAPYILESRMHFSGTLYDTLISLFGVYQYNQPLQFSDGKELSNIEYYQELYNSIYANDDSLFRRLTPVFNSRIPHMLRMAESFKTNNGDFMKEDVYFNTFYWINRKLVPSSYILDQLITQLERVEQGQGISANYTLSEPVQWFTFKKVPRAAEHTPMFEAANQLKMKYDITIDLSGVGK